MRTVLRTLGGLVVLLALINVGAAQAQVAAGAAGYNPYTGTGGRAAAGSAREVITTRTLSALYGAPIEVLQASDGRLVVVGQPEAPFHHGHRHGDDA